MQIVAKYNDKAYACTNMQNKMLHKQGFTVVELIVVIVVIGIITAATTFAYNSVRQQSRDSQRTASATLIAENLEKYYDKNGEYPSVPKITNTNATTVKTLLGMDDVDSLIAPNATLGSTTNIWKTGTPTSTSPLTYSTNNDSSPSCLTGSAATDVCADYKIQYLKESTNTTETLYSRHTAVAATPPPAAPTITAPAAPTVTIALNGNNAVGTRSDTSCRPGAQLLYAFRSRANDGTWSSYTTWGNATSASQASQEGNKYGFQVKAKCVEGDYSSAEVASTEATYIRPITAPATPNIYATASIRPNYNGGLCMDANGAGNTNGTLVQVYTCNGTAAQDWAYNSNDKTIRPTYNMNLCISNQGSGAQVVLWTCDGATARQWNYDVRGYFVSVSNGQCMDAANWGGSGTPINAWNCNNATAQIWNPSDSQTAWTWNNVTCASGTTLEYKVNYQTTNLADSGWSTIGTTNRIVRTTDSQGYTYTTQVQARCYTGYTSTSSGTGQASINKAVLRPGAATGWAFGVWGARDGWGWSWDSPACGTGTNRTYIEESWMGTDNNGGGSIEYWLSPRNPNGPGNIWWYTANSTSGANYIWYAPYSNGRGETYVGHPSGAVMYGLNVTARTQYRCNNPVTGREAIGDWTQTVMNYT